MAQSIGGLIVQRTVTIASYSAVPQVEKHLLGIIFLGTPLRRYDRAGWASLGSNIARLGDLSERTLSDQMMSASVYLDTLSSGFYRVLDPRSEGSTKVNIAAFYEELPTPKIGFVSSILPFSKYHLTNQGCFKTRHHTYRIYQQWHKQWHICHSCCKCYSNL